MCRLSILIALMLLTGCSSESNIADVDTLLINAVVWTGVEEAPDARVVAIRGDKISHVGGDELLSLKASETVDLHGQFVLPGFMDNHVHFMEGGAALASVDLRSAQSPTEFIDVISHYLADIPTGQWILNGNWDHTQWGGELPHRDWIDSITADNPVFVIRSDGHMALANSLALQKAGITSNTTDPDGGVIGRDENGRLTGILKGNALNQVLAVIPTPSDDELMRQFSLAQQHALSHGLTKIHAVTAYPTETTMLELFKMAKQRGLLKIRAKVSTPIESWEQMKQEVEANGRGDQMLSWGGVKGFIDGSLGARTAWMSEPYSDAPDSTGVPINTPEQLQQWMRSAVNHNLELSIHAIGDLAIDTVIQSMQDIASDTVRERRLRIEHFQHPSEKAISEIGRLGIVVAMHPYHAIDDGRWAEERIGKARLQTTYAFRSILDAGGILTFGSDWPVAPLSPIDGIYAAVTRQTLDDKHLLGWVPEQKIEVEEALSAYTSSNAYAFGEEALAGTLEVGKRADIVILSDDPRTIDPSTIREVKVNRTLIDGREVYKRK